MQSIMVPRSPQLKGEDAIVALNFISELESEEKELSEKQTLTLKKLAKCIISHIEEEESRKPRKNRASLSFEATIIGHSKKSESLA